MPSPPLRCFGVGVVLLSLAPSALTFSRGASHASCREMIPGHIRAQPQDPKRSHVALRTSASSYLPGQFITVTVRSSRDFMGFLLQARGAAGAGSRSTGVGAVLVGGSWTLTPPGTHTLRCLSEGDSLTHSDKQLKRNLSFVWRAPDAPMGDIRFYITVVQSYFVYWAGIESAVLRDGSRSPWTGSNTTGVDGGNLARQEEEVTALPAHKASNKPQGTRTEVSRPVSEGNHLTNQAVNEKRNSSNILGSIQTAATGSENYTYTTSGSVSGVTEDVETETGSPEDPKSYLQSTNPVPPKASFSFPPAEAGGVEATTNLSPNITGPLFLLYSLASLQPLKDGEIERNLEDPKPHTIPETEDTTLNSETTTTAIPSTNHGFHNTNPSRPTSQNPIKPIQDQTRSVKFVTQNSSSQPWRTSESQMNLIKDEKGHQSEAQTQNLYLKPSVHSKTSSTKPFFHSQTGTSHTVPFSQDPSSISSPPLIRPFKNPTLQSFLKSHTTPPLNQAYPLARLVLPIKPTSSLPPPENSPSGPKTRSRPTSPTQLQTAAPLSSPPQPLSGSTQVLTQTTPSQSQGQANYPQTDQSKSVRSAEALSISPLPWSQPHSQTAAPQTHTFVWKQSQSFPTLRSNEGKEVKDPPSQAKLKTMGPIFASIPSTTPPSLSVSVSTAFSSTHTLLASSLVHPTTLHPSGGSALISVRTSFTRGALSSSPSSTSTKNQPKTAPSLSALPSPSPISIPPHLPLVDASSTSPLASTLTSSTITSSNSSNYPPLAPLISPVPLSTSSSSPFTSSQSGSTVSSPSFPTISLSSSASSTSTNSSPPSPPSSSISTSTSTSSSSDLSATSSSTSPHPEPSPAPRRSLYNPLTSSTSSPVPSQQLPIGQRLPIQNRIALSNPQPNLNLPTPRTVVLLNSERHPNLDPNFDLNLGHELKPNLPKTDTKPKLLPDPPGTPDKEGKYPDVIPRHSAWELGMLLGCSAGLGMALVVGVRYMCRQACGKQTGVTLNDREAEYGRGERGMRVQECGDLVRVRRIRENSFVLLAEYDVLATP